MRHHSVLNDLKVAESVNIFRRLLLDVLLSGKLCMENLVYVRSTVFISFSLFLHKIVVALQKTWRNGTNSLMCHR